MPSQSPEQSKLLCCQMSILPDEPAAWAGRANTVTATAGVLRIISFPFPSGAYTVHA